MLLYAATIFLSAFLLFAVQPMIGKIILPWFGGSAAVWSTCLLFFQAALLAGYLYAHWSTRYLRAKHQAMLHVALMAASLALLPVLPSPGWKPEHAGDPSGRILLLLAATIGLPYMLLSTTSPLLQAWYVALRPGAIPYRLFALSNFGSLLALVSFPALIEPRLSTRAQAFSWSGVYAAFVVVCSMVAMAALRGAKQKPAAEMPQESTAPALDWRLQVLWAALAACASALLVAMTNHMSQNVAPIPFLWVLTLALYLASFILCFERERIYHRVVFLPLLAVTLGASGYTMYYDQGNPNIKWAIPIFAAALFVCCMVCHGELVRLKPDPRRLTSFYLMVSLGGALGGLFVAVGAPHLFHTFLELPLSMVACSALAALMLWLRPGEWRRRLLLWGSRGAMIGITIALALYLGYKKHIEDQKYETSVRNFYGVLRIRDMPEPDEGGGNRKLIHGTINHGTQLTDVAMQRTPTSYYGPDSGVGRAIRYLHQRGTIRVGVVGLGAGVTAAYCHARDLFQFYEINPLDLSVASTWFTFITGCPGQCVVLLGDARLTMEQQPRQNYDLIALDAFTSDAIPVHLLTRESFALYFRQLRPGGILAVHVSNRYLDLVPVVAQHAKDLGMAAIYVADAPEEEDYLIESDWVLVTSDPEIGLMKNKLFQSSSITRAGERKNLRPWTDDYSNLFQILR